MIALVCSHVRRSLVAILLVPIVAGTAFAQINDDRYFFRAEQQRWAPAPSQANQAPASEDPKLKITVTPLGRDGDPARSPRRPGGKQLVCVRTCDGYFFPVSGDISDPAIAEFVCRTSCPGAPTKLFTRRGDGMENAVGSDRSLYSKLAGALLFQKSVSPACSCQRPNGTVTSGPVYDDPTLRPGDVIVVNGRAVVFKGGSRPYTERDFAPLERSSLPAEARYRIGALLYFRPKVPNRLYKPAGGVATAPKTDTAGKMRVVLPFPILIEPAAAAAFAPEQ